MSLLKADLSAPPAYDLTEAPEADVARDLVRRVGLVALLFVVVGAVFWGVDGALSALFALGLVAANFALSAALITWGARVSPSALLITVLGGYPLRMGFVIGAIWLVKDAAWVEMVPLAFTLLTTHVGLLFWETRHVSMSLAFPGLKPGTAPEDAD